MKLAVEFPSVAYREGPTGVARLAKAIEDIGHKSMGFQWATLNPTTIFQSGGRSVDAVIDVPAGLHARLRAEVG